MKKIISLLLLTSMAITEIYSQIDSVYSVQKINNNLGGLSGSPLDSDDRFGQAVEVIGDIDGDGIDDIAVGSIRDDDGGTNKGAVYILRLNTDGSVKAQQKISSTIGGGPTFSASHLYFGSSIAALGDLNGDGVNDIAVGMYGGNDDNVSGTLGAVYILFLDTNGTVKKFQKISNNQGGGNNFLRTNDMFGWSVSNIGDINNDGLPDIAVGATGRDSNGKTNNGGVFIINLDYNGTAKKIQEISEDDGNFSGFLSNGGQFGRGVTTIGDLNGDGVNDIAVGAVLDSAGGTSRGAIWILFLDTNGTVKNYQKISSTQGGFSGTIDNDDRFGSGLVGLGDLNGDGIGDVAVGAMNDDDGGTNKGAIWILYLDTNGTVKSHYKINSLDNVLTSLMGNNEMFADDISYFGDRNNDGKPDLLVGAWYALEASVRTGEVYVIHLEGSKVFPKKNYQSMKSIISDINKFSNTTGSILEGVLDSADSYGKAIAVIGDLDGDGVDDIAVGAHGDDDGGADRGAVYIQFLNDDGSIKLIQKISDTEGGFTGTLANEDKFGSSITSLGDLNKDGIVDIAVGAQGDNDGGTDRGAVWILFLDTNGTVKSHQKISDTAGGYSGTLANGDFFGNSITCPGDIDGDTIQDIVVGAYYGHHGGLDNGYITVLFLDTNGTVKSYQHISELYGDLNLILDDGDRFGSSLCSIGDFDGNGVPDIAVGAFHDDDGGLDAGAVYLLMLNDTGGVNTNYKITRTDSSSFRGALSPSDYFGFSVSGGFDFDWDGVNDLVVGAYSDDDGGNNRGMVYIIYMNNDGTVKHHYPLSNMSPKLINQLDNNDWFGYSVASQRYNVDSGTQSILVGAGKDDDGAIDAGAVYRIALNIFELNIPSLSTVKLQDKIDGGYYIMRNKLLGFDFLEEYEVNEFKKLNYHIYDEDYELVGGVNSIGDQIIPGSPFIEVKIGINTGILDVTNLSLPINKFYTLEVYNSKNEKKKLKFKVIN